MNLKRLLTCVFAVLLLSTFPSRARCEEGGITVSGTGEAKARPNQLEIDLNIAGAAELTGDALVKYRDAVRRTTQAFEQLGMEGLTVDARELSIANQLPGNAQQMAMVALGQAGAPAAKTQVTISRSLRLVLGGIRDMSEEELTETIGRLLDTARDSGAAIGQSESNALLAQMMGRVSQAQSVVTYVVDDADQQREEAYREAFAQARARAERLAALAGAKLGPVVSVEEVADAPTSNTSVQERMISAIYGIGDSSSSAEDARLTSDKLGDIPVRVTLRVRFALESEGD